MGLNTKDIGGNSLKPEDLHRSQSVSSFFVVTCLQSFARQPIVIAVFFPP
jgi:hypothetical protein